MSEPKPIIISNPQKGIAPSAYLGFQEIRGLNITDKPGVCYPNLALEKESATTVDDFIEKFIKTSEGEAWGYTSENTNSVFKRTAVGVWSELTTHKATGIKDIAFWKGYVAIIHANTISWYNISDDSCDTSWTAYAITDGGHCSIHASDDVLYIGSGKYLDSITAVGTFDPADPATYSVAKGTFKVNSDYAIICLEELGDRLYIGTSKSGDSMAADIFVWDFSSVFHERIIRVNDEGVNIMVASNNLLFVQAGRKGRWYKTNGSSVELLSVLPVTLTDTTTTSLAVGKQAQLYNDLIYFGVTYNGVLSGQGVYSVNISSGSVNFEHIISPNETGANNGINVGGIMALGGTTSNLLVSWVNNDVAFGVDKLSASRYTSDRAYLISQFFRVSYVNQKRTFNQPEIQLAKPLGSGDSLKVEYRTAQNGSWTSGYYSQSTSGFQSGVMTSIPACKNIQLKVTLNNTTELMDVILK
jgi:hypothetical protein